MENGTRNCPYESVGVWLWQNAAWEKAQDPPLTAIVTMSGVSNDDIWAAGWQINDSKPTVAHWDGQNWMMLDEPRGRLVWENAPEDIWICCEQSEDTNGTAHTDIYHWDGTSWTPSSLPTSSIGTPKSIWSRSSRETWVAGADGEVFRFDGYNWVGQPKPDALPINSIWATRSDDVWFVGKNRRIDRWDGSWHQVSIPLELGESVSFNDIWGTAPDNIWVVGSQGVILHWDGQTWNQEASGTQEELHAIWGLESGHLWVVGAKGFLSHREF